MMLVTQRDAVRIKFNSERREINSVADYMRLYLKILQLAFEYDFITSEERDAIASSILEAIQEAAAGKEIVISNYLYVISMKFMTLSNYDCWELMRKITSKEEANHFVYETKSWFFKRVYASLVKAKRGYKMSLELNLNSIHSAWKSCYATLKTICSCMESDSNFSLKNTHNAYVVESAYKIMHVEEGLTALDRIEDFLKKLKIETSILIKIDANKVIKSILGQKEEKIEDSPQMQQAKKEYFEAMDMLQKVEAFYTEKLRKALASEKAYDRVLEEFERTHPDLDADEFADAFDEYWMYRPEYFPEDSVTINEKYQRAREYCQQQIEISKRRLDIFKDEKAVIEGVINRNVDELTLEDILKEYAIVLLAHEGRIMYPNTQFEKEQLLLQISLQMAAKIFLQNEAEKISLTAKESYYLDSLNN